MTKITVTVEVMDEEDYTKNHNATYSFDQDDILNTINLREDLVDNLNEVATILASNVEVPTIEDDGTVRIVASNFNDSYEDMIADLQGD